MAHEGIRNQESLDRASDSRYPLNSFASARDSTGAFNLPNDFLAGLYITIPSELRLVMTSVHIRQIVATPNLVVMTIAGSIGLETVDLARLDIGLVAVDAQISMEGYGLALAEPLGEYQDIKCHAVIARTENIRAQPSGTFTFDRDSGGIDVDCVRPIVRGVSALEVETQFEQFVRLSGPIRMRPGSNTRFRVETESGEPVVYVDAIDASDLNESLQCDDGQTPAIRRINGLPGNSQREILLRESRCLEIDAAGDTIGIRNRCSEPCASCAEAEQVKAVVDPMAQQIPQLVNLITRIQVSVDTQLQAISISQGPLACLQATTTQAP